MTQTFLEGWCTDPWGLHDARWMSAGSPTKLVRDGDVERFEAIPSADATMRPRPITSDDVASHGVDLNRSDQQASDPRQAMTTVASRILTRFSD